jgi:HK97 family phage major capsid protein
MTTKELLELRQRYNAAVKAMRDMHAAVEKEDRGFNADEQAKWDKMVADTEVLQTRIQRAEQVAANEVRSTATSGAPVVEGTLDDPDVHASQRRGGSAGFGDDPYGQAFRTFAIHGENGLAQEQRSLLQRERRDFSTTPGSGGYTIPQGFYNQLIETQRFVGGFVDPTAVTLYETDTGNPVPVPLEDDTANAAAIVAEATSLTTSTDAAFTSLTLGAYMYRTLARVSLELLQDSAFDLESYLARKFGIRLARGYNAHATTGTNSGQPQGLFNASVGAGIGHTAATGNTLNFPYASLVALEHSIDPAYRVMPSTRWMFNDILLQGLKGQLDTTNRPIWMPDYAFNGQGIGQRFPGSILGYPYIINNDAPVMAANARCIAFGDMSAYITRRVRGMMMVRAQERFIDQGQIGFYLFARMDGKYANPTAVAGRAPIRLGQNSAT